MTPEETDQIRNLIDFGEHTLTYNQGPKHLSVFGFSKLRPHILILSDGETPEERDAASLDFGKFVVFKWLSREKGKPLVVTNGAVQNVPIMTPERLAEILIMAANATQFGRSTELRETIRKNLCVIRLTDPLPDPAEEEFISRVVLAMGQQSSDNKEKTR